MSGVVAGAALTAAWLLLWGLLAASARSYAWLTIGAGVLAWLTAFGLARYGDRGVAVGIGLATGIGLAIAFGLVTIRWITVGWPLW